MKNNYRIAQEILHKLLTYQQIPVLQRQDFISDQTREFCRELFNKIRLKNIEKVGNCYLLGSGKMYKLNTTETECLKKIIDPSKVIECKKYRKMINNDCRYSVYSISKRGKRNNSVFQTKYNILVL